jgi:hypothetical protein
MTSADDDTARADLKKLRAGITVEVDTENFSRLRLRLCPNREQLEWGYQTVRVRSQS